MRDGERGGVPRRHLPVRDARMPWLVLILCQLQHVSGGELQPQPRNLLRETESNVELPRLDWWLQVSVMHLQHLDLEQNEERLESSEEEHAPRVCWFPRQFIKCPVNYPVMGLVHQLLLFQSHSV